MHSAVEIADKYVQLAKKENCLFSHMKLQKLIYISNGISLALNDEPLINEHIEAWPYGPVVSSVYHTFKIFGNSNIVTGVFGQYPLNPKLSEKELTAFNDAWQIAKGISAIKLSNWTHNPDSPWSKAKNEGLDIIPDEYMKEFFTRFLATV